MSGTRRQELITHLTHGPVTLRELAERMGLRVRDVVDDLEHVRFSLGDRELLVDPALCQSCGYAFEDRQRLTRPSRCPACRKERITWPVLRIE